MKIYWFFLAMILAFDLNAAIQRNSSISKTLLISAQINVTASVAPGISVVITEPNVRLSWDATQKSFYNRVFQYRIFIDGDEGDRATSRYSVGVRDINLSCTTATSNYVYYGIDTTRVTGFAKPVVRWSNGSEATINSLVQGGDVKSPVGNMSMIYSNEFDREVPADYGSIVMSFPLLTKELADGGADCQGGAILMFYAEL